ncbi:hypothetical protein T458_00060 [Brevibacillus panacihumi W25]|uniref:TnsA endonuclease N-terminal domain-containing protein n=1 Tax=Brevibacillus panacihumi W25 TaxID=1408254 RepID=V6MK03_9BACL|nr:TnsA endonuclease N-terminal domain-containing protein [Brevibacillus panacihumi]EST55778.1 hypothetical protein T458_00060 [Brevibacillus panacihumi W25]
MYKPIQSKGRGHYGNNLWDAYSPKLNRMVRLYSDLERDHWVLIETNPNVRTFCEQPLKVSVPVEGRIVSTIFDMWVQWTNETESFIEIKYSNSFHQSHPNYEDVRVQTTAQKVWCLENKYEYIIRTEEEIRKNTLLISNMKRILSFIRNRSNPVETDCFQIMRSIQQHGKISAQQLEIMLPNISQSRIYEALSWLFYRSEIQANFEGDEFGPKMEVSRTCQEER